MRRLANPVLQTRVSLAVAAAGLLALVLAVALQCSGGGGAPPAAPAPTPTPTPPGPGPVSLASLGIRLAYAVVGPGGAGDLVIHNADDTTIAVRGAHGYFSGIAWSPDGSKLAASFGPSLEVQDIWVLDGDGNNLKRLTTDGKSRRPTWSPDGSLLAFVGGQPGAITTMAADGSARRPLAEALGQDNPAWAPDGSAIAVSGPPGTVQLLSPDRGTLTSTVDLLRDSAPQVTPLSWSGDSSALTAVVLRGTDLALVLLADELTAQRQVGAAVLGNPVDPAWVHPGFAPDGAHLVAASAATGAILAFEMNALPTDNTSSGNYEVQVLVPPPAGLKLAYPAISPLGRRGRTPAIT